jgi:peptide/nickel transport system permease protein
VIIGLGLAMLTAWLANPLIETTMAAFSGVPLIFPSGLAALLLYFAGLPVAVGIASVVFPKIYFYARNLMAEGIKMPHVSAARARGISSLRILWLDVMLPSRPALLAVSSVALSAALGAAIPMEVVCDSPGIGQLAWRAALGRDMVLLTGLTLFISLVTILATSLADLCSGQMETRREAIVEEATQ